MNDNTAFVVFTRLLLLADWRSGKYITGRNKLAIQFNLNPATLYSALKRLEASSMLQLHSNSSSTTIYICNWHKYQQRVNSASSDGQQSVITKQEEEKEEDIDTKVSIRAKTPSVDINEMFEMWQKITGLPINGQQQKNRFACSNLLKKYGKDGLTSMIQGVEMAMNDKFAPRISDFVALQSKQNDLLAWGRKNGGKNESNRFE